MTPTPSHRVLVNDEEQYAIVPAHFPAPTGWREAGHQSDAASCETWVDQHWEDIRPRGVREAADQP
ncbi:MbtH family NRPS accessory protein [Streptomyces sp. NPDC005438]|uniref:MbtH family NRPS accessory protein n=1 Tax=Streptomyces sp. NPDC005438 TaxID=3156880 RepID=UPI0033A7592D